MTYRDIDISGEKRCALPAQAAPLLQWVKISDLVVDETYQRSLSRQSWTSIRKIAAGFDWSLFGAVAVAPVEGGRFALIDGQHRAYAAAICGAEMVPAVVNVLPISAQARAFAVINSSAIKVSPLQIYRAALASGEDWVLQSRDAVAAGGCELMTFNPTSNSRKAGQVFVVQLVRGMVEAGQARVLRAGLPPLLVHAEAMGPMSGPLLFREDVLRPWLSALAHRSAFLRLDLDAFLRRHRLMNLLEAAARLRDQPEFMRTPAAALKRDALIARLASFAEQEVAA